jgi:hypothetical protein
MTEIILLMGLGALLFVGAEFVWNKLTAKVKATETTVDDKILEQVTKLVDEARAKIKEIDTTF